MAKRKVYKTGSFHQFLLLLFSTSVLNRSLIWKIQCHNFFFKNLDINFFRWHWSTGFVYWLRVVRQCNLFLSVSCSGVLGACNTVHFWKVDCNMNLCIEYVWSGVYFDINSKHSFVAQLYSYKDAKLVYKVCWSNEHQSLRRSEREREKCVLSVVVVVAIWKHHRPQELNYSIRIFFFIFVQK